MTCSAEQGIHEETNGLVQKNTQLQETSLTQTAGMGEMRYIDLHDQEIAITKFSVSSERI